MRKLKALRKWRRKSFYKKSLSLFTYFLIILSIIFLVYVYKSMILYERNLVDNYIAYLKDSGKLSKDINNNLFEVSKYERKGAKITDGVKKLLKSKELEIKKNSKLTKDDIYAYDLKEKDKLVATVSLKSKKKYTKMAILTINEWEVEDIETYFDKGIYHLSVSIPKDYKLYINNKEVDSSDIKSEGDIEGLERLTKHIEICKSKNYEIDNLVYEPKVKILDKDNKEVKFKIEDNKIIIGVNFKEISTYEDAKSYIKDDFDIMKFAESYSLFLTADFHGRGGFNILSKNLIKDSYMYEYLRGWATQVDYSFVSNHRLKNPTFTNESLTNFIIYNDNAFSCEVSLEKNMVVNGEDRVDKMHDRMYFIYVDNGYKLVDMKSL